MQALKDTIKNGMHGRICLTLYLVYGLFFRGKEEESACLNAEKGELN